MEKSIILRNMEVLWSSKRMHMSQERSEKETEKKPRRWCSHADKETWGRRKSILNQTRSDVVATGETDRQGRADQLALYPAMVSTTDIKNSSPSDRISHFSLLLHSTTPTDPADSTDPISVKPSRISRSLSVRWGPHNDSHFTNAQENERAGLTLGLGSGRLFHQFLSPDRSFLVTTNTKRSQ